MNASDFQDRLSGRTGSSPPYRRLIDLLGLVSDLNRSRDVWFWEVR